MPPVLLRRHAGGGDIHMRIVVYEYDGILGRKLAKVDAEDQDDEYPDQDYAHTAIKH